MSLLTEVEKKNLQNVFKLATKANGIFMHQSEFSVLNNWILVQFAHTDRVFSYEAEGVLVLWHILRKTRRRAYDIERKGRGGGRLSLTVAEWHALRNRILVSPQDSITLRAILQKIDQSL